MSHELQNIEFMVSRVASYPQGITHGEVTTYIEQTGEVVFRGLGIEGALEYVKSHGFQRSAVFFDTAHGKMAMPRVQFVAWATRMVGLVSA